MYYRTLPMFMGMLENIPNKVDFDQVPGYAVYITINGPYGKPSDLKHAKENIIESSPDATFGVLTVTNTDWIQYNQYYIDSDNVVSEGDHFTMVMVDQEDQEDDSFFRLVIYGVLITCVLGFGYFIYNWVKCILSRPPKEEDDSDSDEESYNGSSRHRKIVKQEMQHVLP